MKYELIIKEIESGNVVERQECDCVIGAVAYEKDGALAANAISCSYGSVIACLGAIAAAQNSIEKFKKYLYEKFKEELAKDLPIKEFEDFFEEFRSKFTAANDEKPLEETEGEEDV